VSVHGGMLTITDSWWRENVIIPLNLISSIPWKKKESKIKFRPLKN